MGRYSAAQDLDLRLKKFWYVLANRTEAFILQDSPSRQDFLVVMSFSNPEGALKEQDLDSDRPSRVFSSPGSKAFPRLLDRRHRRHERVATAFAARIAAFLSQGLAGHDYSELVLVAEPRFLGQLRSSLSSHVRKKVRFEINREFALDWIRAPSKLRLKLLRALASTEPNRPPTL